jgi:hypothetical protein
MQRRKGKSGIGSLIMKIRFPGQNAEPGGSSARGGLDPSHELGLAMVVGETR